LPSGDGKDSLGKFITQPESTTINLLKNKVIEAGSKEYGLYWLGIFLHLYADSYSHQGFVGFYDQHKFSELIKGVKASSLCSLRYRVPPELCLKLSNEN
jgi:hypothetical protein